jgi:DNA (cytosine-5)-methyltransferase 1
MPAVCFTQNSRSEVRKIGGDGQVTGALTAHPGAKQQNYLAQTVAFRGREGGSTAELRGEVATTLMASTGDGDKPHVMTVHGTQDPCVSDRTAFALGRNNGGENAVYAARQVAQTITQNYGKQPDNSDTALGPNLAMHGLAVRRLTPAECELLQGYPPGHTLIPTTKRNWHRELEEMRSYFQRSHQGLSDEELIRLAADGPRYKALGNSMAVPVMRWIARRINMVLGGEA